MDPPLRYASTASTEMKLRSGQASPPSLSANLDLSGHLGDILNYGLFLKREGYRQATIESAVRSLKEIAKHSDLLNPTAVKEYLATKQVSESRKERVTIYLSGFYQFKQLEWTPPRYRRIEKIPFIPQESEVEQLISGMGKKTSCFLQLLRESGCRPGEAWNIRWIDLRLRQMLC